MLNSLNQDPPRPGRPDDEPIRAEDAVFETEAAPHGGAPRTARKPKASGAPVAEPDAPGEKKGKKDKKKKKKGGKREKGAAAKDTLGTSRGIETMFRTSYQQHVALSGLADNKSNIMISINGIIISILIASISPKIDTNPWLLVPTSVLLMSCLASMVYAILSARPRVSNRLINLEEVRQNRGNLLFFGNFVNLPEEQFMQGMTDLMQNTDQLYRSMVQDIYGLGQVLNRKFRLLRVSYTIFMIGLALGVILYIGVYVGVVVFLEVPPAPGVPAAGTPPAP